MPRRDATLAYLDQVVQEQGGRRGRAQVRTPTDGLTWAVSRHATTRAGDPQAHDHCSARQSSFVWGTNEGGWKALDTGLVRDHLHAATAIGRMAAAAKAVELGYGIEPDPGPSGRLGAWAIIWHPEGGLGSARHPLGPDRRRRRPGGVLPGPGHRRPHHPGPKGPRTRGRPRAAVAGRAGPGRLPAAGAGGRRRAGRARATNRPELSHELVADVADELLSPRWTARFGEDLRPAATWSWPWHRTSTACLSRCWTRP